MSRLTRSRETVRAVRCPICKGKGCAQCEGTGKVLTKRTTSSSHSTGCCSGCFVLAAVPICGSAALFLLRRRP
jgi:hypothetical protein